MVRLAPVLGIDLTLSAIVAAYTSSKAALNVFNETLRLELGPLGVSVLTIMAGVIDSKFHTNDSFTLPSSSRYAPIQDIIAGWASGASKPKGCSAEVFAETVVSDILRSSTCGVAYRGPHSSWVAALSNYGPSSMTVGGPSDYDIPAMSNLLRIWLCQWAKVLKS